MELLSIQAEIVRHEVGVVATEHDKTVHLAGHAANLGQRLLLVGLGKLLKEQIVPLQRHDDRHLEVLLDLVNAAGDQDVAQVHQVGLHVPLEPLDQPENFLALMAVLALQHRDRQLAQLLGSHLDAARGQTIDDPRAIEPAIEKPGQVTEQRIFLLQVDVDAAEKHLVDADVGLVGADRGVERHQRHVAAQASQRRGQRVVAHATAAEHAAAPRGEIGDFRQRLGHSEAAECGAA